MGYEIRYIDREHKVAQRVPTLGDYISATIQDIDLIYVAIKVLLQTMELGGGGNAILGYFRPYLSRAMFGFSRCTWPKIALKLKK